MQIVLYLIAENTVILFPNYADENIMKETNIEE